MEPSLMNVRLMWSCAGLWVLGLAGMGIVRFGLGFGPGELAFDLWARVWFVGGLGYVGLAVFGLRALAEADERSRKR